MMSLQKGVYLKWSNLPSHPLPSISSCYSDNSRFQTRQTTYLNSTDIHSWRLIHMHKHIVNTKS